ncbi:hypothetical protein I3842_08G105000 [Carya illinoinensis]|uniref:F-box domain-containing protein n=1 Tax=Carya illinoinensis TaxID=32201 RepID=A0A922EB36_CARIL|nr:hypothetical protein I3842_08G105000 [Carya illinoinensis]
MAMSLAPIGSLASLSSDVYYDILRRLDGPTLASASCACASFFSISKEEKLWENMCSSMWPSTIRQDVKSLISSIGGFRKFYANCFPLIVNKEVFENKWNNYPEYTKEWTEVEYYGDMDEFESMLPFDFISIVAIRYKEKPICSKILWGIPNATGFDGWFYDCPFRIDLLTYAARDDENDGEFTLSISDGLPQIALIEIERERKDGKLWLELCNGFQLSWIVSPLGGQRHWPTDKDFVLRFGFVLPAKDVLPCQVVKCILSMKLRVTHTEGDGGQTTLKVTELSINSLLILKEALSCHRSKNYSEVLESCHLYSKVQSKLKEEKIRNESRFERLCILSGIGAFMMFWYCIL